MAHRVTARLRWGLCLVVLCMARGVLAQPIDLAWEAPAECPDRSWVLRSLEARLGAAAAQPRAAMSARGRVERRGDSFVLELQTEQGERRLSAASCQELASSAALILAFAIDPAGVQPEAAAEPAVAAVAISGDTRPLDLGGYTRVEWLVDVGMLPHAGTGPGVAVGLRLAQTSIELTAGFLLSNTVRYLRPGSTGGTAELAHLQAFEAQLGLCQELLREPRLGLCLQGEHMRIHADPSDLVGRAASHSAPVWTLLAAARLVVPIGTHFAWLVELGAGVPLHGARFRVDGIGVIHETGDVVGRLRSGLGVTF